MKDLVTYICNANLFQRERAGLACANLTNRQPLAVNSFDSHWRELTEGIWAEQEYVIETNDSLETRAWYHSTNTLNEEKWKIIAKIFIYIKVFVEGKTHANLKFFICGLSAYDTKFSLFWLFFYSKELVKW